MDANRRKRYRELVASVKGSYGPYEPDHEGLRLSWCEDCEEINLWTYWQGRGNLAANIMLVGQDWGSPWDENAQPTMEQIRLANAHQAYDYLHNNPSVTDRNLIRLFREIGYDITKPCPDLFFTNFVLGYRNKGISGGYRKKWADRDKEYFSELVNIVTPRVVLCLGRSTFEAVLSAMAPETIVAEVAQNMV